MNYNKQQLQEQIEKRRNQLDNRIEKHLAGKSDSGKVSRDKVAYVRNAILIGLVLVVIAIVGMMFYSATRVEYLAGTSGTVAGWIRNDEGELTDKTDIPRGLKAVKTGRTMNQEGQRYIQVEIRGWDREGSESQSDNAYYVKSENLTNSSGDIVQEKEVYVRTPVTVYENEEGPEIASFMKKGSKMEVLGYDKLLDTGYVNKYKVSYEDVTGKSGEGYVYGKYMVGTLAEARKNYNKNGEYNTARKHEYGFDLGGGHAKNLDYYPVDKPSFEGKPLCTDARTMYINTYAAVHPDAYVKLIKETDCNAVCIDIKDGPLTYKSEVAKEVSPYSYKKAYASIEDFKKGVKAYKDAGVYTIGRIVVFNDTRYAKNHPEDCIKSGGSKNWPSGFSRDVWEYNVRIALEAIELCGFDEIQFDYCRFPETSYDMSKGKKTNFRNVYGEEKAQAIQNFCFYAADQLHEAGAYMSVDVFGECSNAYVTAYGQYWPAISNVADAVSSMPYTDHYGTENDTWTHPYNIMHAWAKNTAQRQKEIPTPAVDRTWITGYNTPFWNPTVTYDTAKMKQQIKALRDAGLKGGFIPWHVLSDIEKYRSYKTIWNEPVKSGNKSGNKKK